MVLVRDDLDFSDLKKRLLNKKKVTFDLEVIQLKVEQGEAMDDGDDLDDGELGDDVFAHDGGEGHRTVDPGSEAWVVTTPILRHVFVWRRMELED